MPKGFFSQTVCLMLREPTTFASLAPLLADYTILRQVPMDRDSWQMGGDTYLLQYQPDLNGKVAVDLVNHRWPDAMGDPKGDFNVFGAWTMGHFGPFTFPGSLERAAQQSWSWPGSRPVPEHHTGFIRVRISYVFGGGNDLLVLPEGVNATEEMDTIIGVARALMEHPAVWCYFNPAGELLLDAPTLDGMLGHCTAHDQPRFDPTCNIRYFRAGDGWSFMDTVGLWQYDLPDHVMCFPDAYYEPNRIAAFLRNVAQYEMSNGGRIDPGDYVNAPDGERWFSTELSHGIGSPPRVVLRWHPESHPDLPSVLDPPPLPVVQDVEIDDSGPDTPGTAESDDATDSPTV